jgi:molybdate transport repressor ModE-like protein
MDLTQLRYLRAVAREGSITAAARALRVSQSTLSQAVRSVEDELGTPLFLRARNGVIPTEAGALLVDRAAAALAIVDQAAEEVRELEVGDRGRFVIGCHDSLGAYFLPELLATFLRQYPRIDLQISNGSSAEVRLAVIARTVHFGLIVNTAPHPDLVIVDVFHDEIRIMGCPEDLRLPNDQVTEGPLIYPARPAFEEVIRRLVAMGIAPKRTLPVGDLGLARSLGRAGIGPVVLPRRVAEHREPGRLVVLHPDLPYFRDTIHLVWRADMPRTRAAQKVREAMQAHGKLLDARLEIT